MMKADANASAITTLQNTVKTQGIILTPELLDNGTGKQPCVQ